VRFEPAVTAAAAVLVTPTSALVETFVMAVEPLLPGFKSFVVVETLAVLLIVEPFGVDEAMVTTRLNVAVAPGASDAIEQLWVVVPLHVKVGPPVCVFETKVVLAGRVSVHWTLDAVDGPLFVTVIA